MSAGVALWRWKRARSGTIALLMLWVCLGALRLSAWAAHPDAGLREVLPEEPRPASLHGLVADDPVEAASDAGRHGRRPTDRQTCVVAVRHVRTAAGWRRRQGRVRATIVQPRTPLRYGDEILVDGTWAQVPAPGNPGQYDWRAALARQRVHGLVQVRPFDGLVVLRHGQGHAVLAAVCRLRRRWARLIRTHFSPRDAGLLLGLLLGQRAKIDDELEDAFRTTGTIHLLVISGFNVGLIALLFEWVFRLLGLPWRLRLAGSAIGLGGYCLLTGLAPPVARATLMAWVALGAYALDRVISWPNTLAAAALAILWLDPAQLFDPGFQLSFGAVASLLAFTPRWMEAISRWLGWIRPRWLGRYVALSAGATGAVWVGLAPVLAWYFQLVSPVSLVANLLIAPPMSALISAGTALLLAATVVEGALAWAGGALSVLLEVTLRGVWWCRAIPGGFWFVPRPSPWWLAGYYGLLALSGLRRRLGWSCGRLLVCWAGGLALWVWSASAIRALDSRWLRVDILDVGHGDSILVRTPAGQTVLVDAGSQEAGRHQVVSCLRDAGITSLDALVLTHTDEDHLGGAIPLLQQVAVKRLLTNGARDDTMSARRVRALASARGIPETVLAAGMTLQGDPGAVIEVLHPPAGLVPGTAPTSNDNSVVLRVAKGNVSLLLTGDIEEGGLPWLLRREGSLGAAVLKVPHHGSRLGRAGERLFRAVKPRLAILSVGHAHGLPAAETVQALREAGATLYSTREAGAVHLRTDGVRLEVRTFRTRKHHTYVGF